MQAKVLNFIDKGRRVIARVEVTEGEKQVIIPVPLDKVGAEAQLPAFIKERAERRFKAIEAVEEAVEVVAAPVLSEGSFNEVESSPVNEVSPVDILKASLEAKINEVIEIP